jgi:hypothetical protein
LDIALAPPVSFAIEDALAHCRTVEEAVRRINAQPRGNGALLMLADASGQVLALELSSRQSRCRRPPRQQDYLFHTNAYRLPEMRQVEPHRTAVYGAMAPAALRGQPVFQSPLRRALRLGQLLRQSRQLDPYRLAELMADHDRLDQPSSNTICMHGGYWSTVATLQFVPTERRLRLGYGFACQAEYVDFTL